MEVFWVLVVIAVLASVGIWYGKRTGDPSRRIVHSKLNAKEWSAGSTPKHRSSSDSGDIPDCTNGESGGDGGGCGGGD